MNTEIIKPNQLAVTEIVAMAKTFAESGMFNDTKQMAQAFVKIQAGQEIGIPPFAAMSGIHIIQGKPVMGAGLIASTVKGSGKYDYKVIKMDNSICSIDFFQGKEKVGTSSFTIEEAKKAGTKNIEKYPRNMLFARAISNGVKWFCPDVFSGPVYVPEEMQEQETHDIPHTEIKPEKTSKKIELKEEWVNAIKDCSTQEEVKKVYMDIPESERLAYKKLATEVGEGLNNA